MPTTIAHRSVLSVLHSTGQRVGSAWADRVPWSRTAVPHGGAPRFLVQIYRAGQYRTPRSTGVTTYGQSGPSRVHIRYGSTGRRIAPPYAPTSFLL
eukprot:663950-Rhodomonas_salina.1